MERSGMRAAWSMPAPMAPTAPPPTHQVSFFSFSCSISHSDVWLVVSGSAPWGPSSPLGARGRGPEAGGPPTGDGAEGGNGRDEGSWVRGS